MPSLELTTSTLSFIYLQACNANTTIQILHCAPPFSIVRHCLFQCLAGGGANMHDWTVNDSTLAQEGVEEDDSRTNNVHSMSSHAFPSFTCPLLQFRHRSSVSVQRCPLPNFRPSLSSPAVSIVVPLSVSVHVHPSFQLSTIVNRRICQRRSDDVCCCGGGH